MTSVLIPLAQGCEELEAVTLIDVLRRAKLDVTSAGLDEQPITASRGTRLIPDTTLENALRSNTFDLIALPGGLPGADHLNNDLRLREALRETTKQGKYVAAICAAPKVLANAGLLEGRAATCYPGSLTEKELTGVQLKNVAVVQDGTIVTSRGPGTAMDFALHLVEILCGKKTRDDVETGLQR